MSLVFPTQEFDSNPLSAFGPVSTSLRESPRIDPSFGEILETVGGRVSPLPCPSRPKRQNTDSACEVEAHPVGILECNVEPRAERFRVPLERRELHVLGSF